MAVSSPPSARWPDPPEPPDSPDPTERDRLWASTMHGHPEPGPVPVHRAHRGPPPAVSRFGLLDRLQREQHEAEHLAPAATRADGAGRRAVAEVARPVPHLLRARPRPHPPRQPPSGAWPARPRCSCSPSDHQRTRLTHALEVAQVATSIAAPLGLNVALTEAIALGHDCGHGPGGHASEDAFSPFLAEGYDHAVWGADVVLAPLNLCAETLDGIRNHSWSPPGAGHPRGRGRGLGRPHRLRLPRLRGRGLGRRRRGRRPARRWCASAAGSDRSTQLAPLHQRRGRRHHRSTGAVGMRATGPRPWPRSAPSTTSASTCARRRWPRPSRSSACCGRWSSTSRPCPPCCPGTADGARPRGRLARGPAGRGHLRGRHDRPLRLRPGRVTARLAAEPAAPRGRPGRLSPSGLRARTR